MSNLLLKSKKNARMFLFSFKSERTLVLCYIGVFFFLSALLIPCTHANDGMYLTMTYYVRSLTSSDNIWTLFFVFLCIFFVLFLGVRSVAFWVNSSESSLPYFNALSFFLGPPFSSLSHVLFPAIGYKLSGTVHR